MVASVRCLGLDTGPSPRKPTHANHHPPWPVKALAAGAVVAPLSPTALAGDASAACTRTPHWAHGIEGQRKADLGNGIDLNPIVAGDHPDPIILKDGNDDYIVVTEKLFSNTNGKR